MAKFSILTAIELMEEEFETQSLVEVQIKKENNPYWGLKCNRELWLTRFLKGSLPKDVEFTLTYIKAGGGFDSVGYWGIIPEHLRELESQGWNYDQIALLGQGVPEDLCRFDGVTPNNWKILGRGIRRSEALKKMGVEYSCSDWTLGSLPIEKFLKRLFKNGVRVTDSTPLGGGDHLLTINFLLVYRPSLKYENRYGNTYTVSESFLEGFKGRPIDEGIISSFLPKNFLAYCRRCTIRKEIFWQSSTPFIFSSLRAAKIFATRADFRWEMGCCLKGIEIRGTQTSCGYIFQIHKEFLLAVEVEENPHWEDGRWVQGKEINRSLYSIRQVAGFNVSKIRDTWFVWKGNNFFSHFEGEGSLKRVLEMAEKREKKNSLILSLNDVRNDKTGTAGFCLSGTRWFLKNRMPFVYRMVAQYSSWAEIPEEIMSTEWHLASRDIFQDYPSPVN